VPGNPAFAGERDFVRLGRAIHVFGAEVNSLQQRVGSTACRGSSRRRVRLAKRVENVEKDFALLGLPTRQLGDCITDWARCDQGADQPVVGAGHGHCDNLNQVQVACSAKRGLRLAIQCATDERRLACTAIGGRGRRVALGERNPIAVDELHPLRRHLVLFHRGLHIVERIGVLRLDTRAKIRIFAV
jgi:hypothetical protein